ncbi:hypothetical protein SDC9_00398 [bioreactor metagenome]|uniref:Uncharacterized protein n=1 Tax=bioreactor metagenome TaxID=1076179 RepID=A0A644SMU3_9ZZZZ
MDIKDKVKSFEDACKLLDITPSVPVVTGIPEKYQKPLIANYQLMVIAEALNEGWTPDWSNGEWDKWHPWFDMDDSSSAGRFSFLVAGLRHSRSTVGSRLCFKSEELAEYAGTQFLELYRELFVIE